jgi:DNA-binding transcriptional ArsR family regulator
MQKSEKEGQLYYTHPPIPAGELMRKVLWWLIGGSRGGKNRFRIIRTLENTPMNANQLASTLDLDYKTVRHHLELLVENDVAEAVGDGYGDTYFLTEPMESNLDVLETVAESADFEAGNLNGRETDE